MKRFLKEILIDNDTLVKKIKVIAKWVNTTYQNTDEDNFIVIGLLKGCIPFLAEISKHITVVHKQDFMILSSYKGKTESGPNLDLIADLKFDVEGKDILLVEDIIESGRTVHYVKELLISRKAKSVRVVTLLLKKGKLKVDLEIDKFGFAIDDVFLVGFGLDIDEKLRNLQDIYVFDAVAFNKSRGVK